MLRNASLSLIHLTNISHCCVWNGSAYASTRSIWASVSNGMCQAPCLAARRSPTMDTSSSSSSRGCCASAARSITSRPSGRPLSRGHQALQPLATQGPQPEQNHLELEQPKQLTEAQPPPAAAAATAAAAEHSALSQTASLSAVLDSQNVSFATRMSILAANQRRAVSPEHALTIIQGLRRAFEPEVADVVLRLVPDVFQRRPEVMIANFEGLVPVLGAGRSFALEVVKKDPCLLNHKPDTVAAKIAALSQMLQTEVDELRKLLLKAPVLLRLRPEHTQACVDFLQTVAGFTPPEVYKVFMGWPVMASTSNSLLQRRFYTLQQLLGASAEDMKYICKNFPSLLGRDPAELTANMQHLAQYLHLTADDLRAVLLKQPGLLSWNPSTLMNRITVLCQVLSLPQDMKLSLLGFNRPLLTHFQQIPERLEHLKQILQVSDQELLPLVKVQASVLRLTPEMLDVKWAKASCLAQLHPPWAEAFAALNSRQKLRILQSGHGGFWRLAYLLHSGQQNAVAFFHALSMSQAKFEADFPGFPLWVDRYNHLVTSSSTPLVPALPGVPPKPFMPITLDNSIFQAKKPASRSTHNKAASPQIPGSGGDAAATANCHSLVASHATCGRSPVSQQHHHHHHQHQQQHLQLPDIPAGVLAAWWGIDFVAAEMLLSSPGLWPRLSWLKLQQRLTALERLLAALGLLHAAPADQVCIVDGADADVGALHGSASKLKSRSSSSNRDDAAINNSAGMTNGRVDMPFVSVVSGSPLLQDTIEATSAVQPQGREATQLSPVVEADRDTGQQQQQRCRRQHNMIQQQQQTLQQALTSGSADVVAVVSVACRVAPFSQQLFQLPPRPPEAVVQFVLQHAAGLGKKVFVPNCNMLAALAASSPYLRQELQRMDLKGLAGCISSTQPRLQLVQYLVQTQQPTPWAFSLGKLLHDNWKTREGRRREQFLQAYPGYAQWEEMLHSV